MLLTPAPPEPLIVLPVCALRPCRLPVAQPTPDVAADLSTVTPDMVVVSFWLLHVVAMMMPLSGTLSEHDVDGDAPAPPPAV